uniref:Capsule synthesis protein PGA_cap n=1 Tax=Candidatus Kentrum eta TaxID=2126337 RepID=A0A450UB21_9GAMM|nr:MAG: capsule synthesis protein PGA_cap [Candidatus Kentron sp. H]VFJ89404.1 MAG: capsule synthesis protein PGA_cap [Candidatus Kentron sp. H]VFJ96005.1 MAG: capsule synthesis protein PGA_cap [Candidatus Kentron sp. H]
MFGRRYYDPNQDGDTKDGLLPPDPGAKDHLALLQWARPLLSSPHMTVLNLETPLAEKPWYHHRNQPRPAGFDPKKSITFASHVSAARALKQAGVDVADLANNHHGAHVTGGFHWDGRSLVAWGLGNFAFDQNYWMTFQSYLLTVHLREGKVLRAHSDPLMIEGYLPKAVSGGFADYIAREAAGREPASIKGRPFLVEDGAMESDFHYLATRKTTTVSLAGGAPPGRIFALPRAVGLRDGGFRFRAFGAGSALDREPGAGHHRRELARGLPCGVWPWTRGRHPRRAAIRPCGVRKG